MKKVVIVLTVIAIFSSCATTTENAAEPVQVVENDRVYNDLEKALSAEGALKDKIVENESSIKEDNKKIIEAIEKQEKIIVEVPLQTFITNKAEDKSKNDKRSQQKIVEDNIEMSVTKITDSNFTNAELEYNYLEGMVYPLYVAPDFSTDLELQKGEIIVSSPIIGDKASWKLALVDVVGTPHIYVKPRTHSLTTNLIINTNKRVYRFKLTSTVNNYMAAVKFNYDFEGKKDITFPAAANNKTESKSNNRAGNYQRIADMVMKDEYNNIFWNYKIVYKPNKRYKPKWYPDKVFDDGMRTYIFVPDIVRSSVRPMVMSTDKKLKEFYMINYRINGKYYIVDGVYNYLLLAAGTGDKEKVFLVRGNK